MSTAPPMPAPQVDVAASRRIALLVAAAFFMEQLDASIIVTALPDIAGGFHVPLLSAGAGVTIYLLAMTVFVPAAGWLADRLGARRLFAGAVGAFTLASLACGLAPSLATFVIARGLQGAASAFMSPVGRVVVLRETPKNRLIEAVATITWPALIGPVVGPPLGGFIVTHASWRWIFLLNLPIGLVGIVLILRMLQERPRPARVRFDLPGFVLTALGLASTIQGLSMLGEQASATTAATLAIAGLACLAVAVRHARRTHGAMLDLRPLAAPTFVISTVTAGFLSRIAINAAPFLLPLMFQVAFDLSPFEAGSLVLVYMAGNLVMKVATTPTLRRFGFRKVLVVNGALCAASLVACGLLTPGTPRLLIAAVLFLAGAVRSLNFSAVNTLAFVDIHDEQRAGASALATMLQQATLALAVTVSSLTLALSRNWRVDHGLRLVDFRAAWLVAAALMLVAALWSTRLAASAGQEARK
jgi:EmrB/QacA subfamily drug resistance transporter